MTKVIFQKRVRSIFFPRARESKQQKPTPLRLSDFRYLVGISIANYKTTKMATMIMQKSFPGGWIKKIEKRAIPSGSNNF